MSEFEKPKRNFWQLHLITAIVLMLTAGGLVGLNFKQTNGKFTLDLPKESLGEEYPDRQPILVPTVWDYQEQGWPFPFRTFVDLKIEGQRNSPVTSIRNLITDSGICIVILTSISFVSEWMIRRGEARKL